MVQKLGLSAEEVGEYFAMKAEVNSATLQVPKMPGNIILPGMFVYADNSISFDLFGDRKVKAVVGYVDEAKIYAVCLKENCLPWSSDWLEVETARDAPDGKRATKSILKFAEFQNQKAEAAQWCNDFAEDGVAAGEAFLPSFVELKKIFKHISAVNDSLKVLNAPLFDKNYLSSSELSRYFVAGFCMKDGSRFTPAKYNSNFSIRPVLVVKI